MSILVIRLVTTGRSIHIKISLLFEQKALHKPECAAYLNIMKL